MTTKSIRHVGRRAAWGIGDQALSSLSNLGVNMLVARTLSPEDFGAFGLVYAGYLLLVGLLRGFLIEPFAIGNEATGEGAEFRRMLGAGAVLAGACLSSLGPMVWLAPLDRSLRLLLVISIPFLVYVEVARAGSVVARRPATAFWLDSAWAAMQLTIVGTILAFGQMTAIWAVASWTTGAAVACLLTVRVLPAPSLSNPARTLRDSSRLGAPWMLEFFLTNGTAQLIVWGVGFVSSLAAVGALRGGMILIGPSTVFIAGLRLVLLPEIARSHRESPARLPTIAGRATAVMAVVAAVTTVPILFIPDSLGSTLLGETWEAARLVLPWLVLYRVTNAAANGPLLGLRALTDRRSSLAVRAVVSVCALTAALTGAAIEGATGAAVGLAAVFTATLPLWYVGMLLSHRQLSLPT